MKKTQMALAAVALVASTAAMAADVTVSGRLDYGYASDNSSTSSQTGLQGSLLAPNFFNVGGSEDLGGGLKASFNWSNIFQSGAVQANANVAGVSIGATYVANNSGETVGVAQADNASAATAYVAGDSFWSGQSAVKGDYSIAATTDLGPVKVGAGGSRLSTSVADGAATTATAKTHWFAGLGTTIGGVTANGLYMKLNTTTVAGVNGSIPVTDSDSPCCSLQLQRCYHRS
jgi:predicted porin